jgi:hypothetical protein
MGAGGGYSHSSRTSAAERVGMPLGMGCNLLAAEVVVAIVGGK